LTDPLNVRDKRLQVTEASAGPIGDGQFVAVEEVAPPAAVPPPLSLSEDATAKRIDNAPAASGQCGAVPCSAAAAARSSPLSATSGDPRGQPGSYVPSGALSVSAARRVNGKFYPAGSLEYLHGQYHIPFPLPDVPKQ